MNKAVAVGVGGIFAAVLAFLAANFKIEALTPLAQSILVFLGWIISAVVHVPNASGHTGLKKIFGNGPYTK